MSVSRDRLREEIAAVPDHRIPDLLRLVHDFRLEADQRATGGGEDANDFAGIWADLSDQDFDAFLGEVEEGRLLASVPRWALISAQADSEGPSMCSGRSQ